MKDDDLTLARLALTGRASCVACRDGEVRVSETRGIGPMVDWLTEDENSLRGASVADRIIGRAAALLMVYGGVKECFGEVVSRGALQTLEEAGIPCAYMNTAVAISNRRGDGICPMERLTAPIKDPKEAFEALKNKLAENKQ